MLKRHTTDVNHGICAITMKKTLRRDANTVHWL